MQLAPYNTQYERLAAHMEDVGVFAEPNLWDQPVSLAREHGRATPDTPTAASRLHSGGASGSGAPHSPGSPTGGAGVRARMQQLCHRMWSWNGSGGVIFSVLRHAW